MYAPYQPDAVSVYYDTAEAESCAVVKANFSANLNVYLDNAVQCLVTMFILKCLHWNNGSLCTQRRPTTFPNTFMMAMVQWTNVFVTVVDHSCLDLLFHSRCNGRDRTVKVGHEITRGWTETRLRRHGRLGGDL